VTVDFDVQAWKARSRRDQERRAKRDASGDINARDAEHAHEETGEEHGEEATTKKIDTKARPRHQQRIKFSLGDVTERSDSDNVGVAEHDDDDDDEHQCEHALPTTGDAAAEEELRRVFKKTYFDDLQVRSSCRVCVALRALTAHTCAV
jgi:hypothetical protein